MSIFFNLRRDGEGKRKVVDYLSREYGGVGLDILEFVPENAILCSLGSMRREEIISLLAERIARVEKDASTQDITEAVIDREELGSTVVEGGIAFPHARTEKVEKLHIAVANSKEGFDFGEDGTVRLVFLLVSNDEYASHYLLALAALARIVRDPANLKRLMEASSPLEVKEVLVGSRVTRRGGSTVGDVMKTPRVLIDPETPLSKVGYVLEENELDCAFVVDDRRRLLGEINDLDLLRVTAADFFGREEHAGIMLARDAMQRNVPVLRAQETIADAAMKMVETRRNRMPVVDEENRILGEVIWTDLIGKMMAK